MALFGEAQQCLIGCDECRAEVPRGRDDDAVRRIGMDLEGQSCAGYGDLGLERDELHAR